jgi:hypothetical protein
MVVPMPAVARKSAEERATDSTMRIDRPFFSRMFRAR